MQPKFFTTPDEFRSWLDEHHDSEKELWVGFHKKGSVDATRKAMSHA